MAPYWGTVTQTQQAANDYQNQLSQIADYYQDRERFIRQSYSASQPDLLREIENLKKENADLKKLAEHFRKGGFMNKPMNFSKFFDSGYDCRKHDTYKCNDCYQEMIQNESTALTLVASSMVAGDSGFESEQTKLNAEESLSRQLRFVKKALAMGDPALKKKKVKELPELIKKAQEEITIGGMQELLGEDNRDSRGILKGIARFFLNLGKR